MGQHHARLYSQLNCKLAGVADADPARAKETGEKYGVPSCADYRDLMGTVDAVSIAVPTTLHHRVAAEFINAGVHCLVEKPIASTIEEAEDMVRLAEENGVKLMVGHIERFNPAITRLKQLIDEGALGKIIMISTRRVGPFVPRIRDVGIIIDSATHDIDVARYIAGKEPVRVFSKTGRFQHEKEDHAVIILDFEDITASLEVNWFTPHKVRTLVATGSKGIAYVNYIDQDLKLHNSREDHDVTVLKAEPLKIELEHFLKCVADDCEPLVNGYEGLKVLKVALQAVASK
jgi:UDP-N-acetylglucosamine 3-dehydrogenase